MNIFEFLDRNGISPAVEFKRLIFLFDESRYFDEGEGLSFFFKFLLEAIWPHLPCRYKYVGPV